jgi:hypothetical protein
MDKRLDIKFPKIEFDTSAIILEAEHIIEKKQKRDSMIFVGLILLMGSALLISLVYMQQYFIIVQIVLMVIISPLVLLGNFINKFMRKGHSHEY